MRLAPLTALAAFAPGLSSPLATAQDDPHAACTAVGGVPREVLQRPVGLRREAALAADASGAAAASSPR